jgi:hypothetical protein
VPQTAVGRRLTSGSFSNDIVAEVGGNTGITIQTATLDAANSTVEFA